MLTATDLHYLVGLLTKTVSGEDVLVELGDQVYDAAAESERDVDITVTTTDELGNRSVYVGIEVKGHKKPLGSDAVEQLACKLQDMPDITDRAIVSGSGFSEPAVRKAHAHNVELFEVIEWPDPTTGFTNTFSKDDFSFVESGFFWADEPYVQMNLSPEDLERIQKQPQDVYQVCDKDGKPYPEAKNSRELCQNVAITTLNDITAGNLIKPDAQTTPLKIRMDVTTIPFLKVGKDRFPIDHFTVEGIVGHQVIDRKPEFKALRKFGEEILIVGCALTELSNGNLIGISVDNEKVSRFNIAYKDRLKDRPYKQSVGQRV